MDLFLLRFRADSRIFALTMNTNAMSPLNLPPYEIKLRMGGDGRPEIFDFLRRRYVALTPEEWVRQHFTHYLVEKKGYPAGLLANEVGLDVGGAHRRCDSVLFDRRGGRPRLIVEYKAPEVRISQKVFTQICSYNSVLRADYLVVSNGMSHYACRINYADFSIDFLKEVPSFEEL